MDGEIDIAGLLRSFEELSGCVEKARAVQGKTERLIASAEYELDLVRKSLAGVRLAAH